MSFYELLSEHEKIDTQKVFSNVKGADIERIINSENISKEEFLALLSPKAEEYLELMAGKAHDITRHYFGKAIHLYTPMYLSDYCDNRCTYCGFSADNPIPRKKLTMAEVEEEAKYISATGLRHILILTGSSRKESPLSYIKDCIKVLKKYFTSISIEIYVLTEKEYVELIEEGVDGLTIYQEIYDQDKYKTLHLSGAKSNFKYRLDAPERAARNGMRVINIGVLLGLTEWRAEAFKLGLHGRYLQDKYPFSEISLSIPRIRPHTGDFMPETEVSDKNIVQFVVAMRIFLPRLGITLSTREDPEFRENILPLGITKMSADSVTSVGGHTSKHEDGTKYEQFEISDKRDVEEIRKMLKQKGYQAVFKDWMPV